MEQDLIRRAQAGDQAAFRSLVESYLPVAWRISRILLTDRSLAEDALQDAWIDVWRALPMFEAMRPFRPWLLTVIANRCKMVARRRHVRTVPLDEILIEQGYGVDAIAAELELQERHETDMARAAALQTELNMLTQEQRQLLALRYQAELELGEIAEIMGVPVGTIKSRLHRTLAALRIRLTSSLASQASSLSPREA